MIWLSYQKKTYKKEREILKQKKAESYYFMKINKIKRNLCQNQSHPMARL